MQNVVINMCEKFHYDRFRNDRDFGNGKSDNNNNNNVRIATGNPFPRPKVKAVYFRRPQCACSYKQCSECCFLEDWRLISVDSQQLHAAFTYINDDGRCVG